MKKSLLLRLVLVIVAFVGITFGVNAQVTTSSITGTIKDAKGALPGASVKATHTPTGTVYSVSTNNDGRFTIGGTRVGGPYTIEISFVGYRPEKLADVYLKLGEPYLLNVVLSDNSSTLSEVNVVGQSTNSIMNSSRNGTSTVITKQQIQSLPTITRSVNDLTRLTPQANNTSIGGGNYRSNNFTVDGANFNNQFGIGQNIPAGGSPISIDALEQISINVTPFDVRQTGFTGGSVTAVTRSGTNTFTGSAFYTMRGDEQQGKRIGETYRIPSLQKLDEKNYGASFGGPIIKDKLFFFVNYEKKHTIQPGTTKIASTPELPFGGSSPSFVSRPTVDFLNGVSSYLQSKYGYATGPYQGYSNISDNEKMFARLDWNISKTQRFSVRYNQVESQSPSSLSNSTTGSGVTFAAANNRVANTALSFANSNYYQAANLYSGVAELTSSFGSKITNVARATYSHQNDPRTSDSSPFPLVDILDGSSVITSFGYEPFTYGNLRDVKGYTYSDDLSIALGKHNLSVGVQAEFSTTKNGFQRFGTGYYVFNSWADFVNGAKPSNYAVTYPLTADGSQAYPSFKFNQYSAYLQDEFTVTDRLKLTAGLRVEQASYPDVSEVKTHPLVAGLNFAGQKVDTGVLPENRISYSPRFGFNWNVFGDRSFQVRGGTGIFTGRIPFVWIVSQSGDAGLLQYTQTYSGQANTPFFNPSIAPNLLSAAPAAGSSIPSSISVMSPNLKFPQTWKSSIAFDIKLPWGIVGTLEGIYGRDLNVAVAKNINLVDPIALNISGYGDTRPMFPSGGQLPTTAIGAFARQNVSLTGAGAVATTAATTSSSGFNVIQMSNAKGGYNWQATAQLTKQFQGGLSAMIAYTRSDQRNYGDGGGDQLLNLWSIPQTSGNPNSPTLSYSSNLNPDRIIANISYRKEYFANLATSFSLFYEGSQQGRFSYTYSTDFNRDGISGNDLIYIPKDASDITFSGNVVVGTGTQQKTYTPQQQSDIFMAYIEQDKYLSKHKGEYAQRNAATSPWRNQFDFRLTQEVFKNYGKSKNSFQVTVDIFNVGNLLNRKWGNVNFVNSTSILVPQNVGAINNTTKPTFRLNTANNDIVRETFGTSQTISSTYYMQFGVRYNFN
ncbi:TonB-dependent receptor domain-containing protein [Pedobacter jeongneungensis]|uniref:TonB-dependent receptor n=1 Tax=Pedobacter jeongneungensis TaxID=947309 RepID=UPI000468235F|nr:TonB-dependent receptor [Pedobacter jeongneungensis]